MPVILRWLLRLWVTNPITVRLVQNGSRRTRHMYIRAGYLAVLIVVLLWSLLIGLGGELSYRDLAAKGAASFTSIAFLQITLICILAPVFMAGAIAQEASPRTWEVLLTTPLTAAQIVLGNLLGRLFFILALLFCSLPLFALTQYFGGVPGSSILASYLIAACAALVVGSIAIALSVSRMVGKRAVFAFYVSVVSYLAITVGIDFFLAPASGSSRPVTYMTALNPFLTLYTLLNPSTYTAAPAGSTVGLASWFLEHPVRTYCVIALGVSLALMSISTFTVRAGGVAMLTGDSGGTPWYRTLFGLPAAGAEHRAPRPVWTNPIAWREAAARNATAGRIFARWSFIGLGGLFGLLLVILYHTGAMVTKEFQLAMLFTVLGEISVTSLVAINMAATAISREREDGTLDLLLTTPITPSQYLWGKLRGLVAYLLPMLAVPLGTLAAACVYVFMCQTIDGFGPSGGITYGKNMGGGVTLTLPAVLPEAALLMPLVVLPFIAACAMVGLQQSLKSKGTIGSVVVTVGFVGVGAGLFGLCAWKAGESINLLGPVLTSMTPATSMFAMLYPGEAMIEAVSPQGSGLATARACAAVGAVLAAALYTVIVYGIHANMVRTFDVTVRRLAGTK